MIIIAIFPLEEILTTFKDGASRALRVFTETKLVNNSIPDAEPVPIKSVDNNGNELFTNNNPGTVQLSGSILAQDTDTGNAVPLKAIQDASGNWHLSIVNSAPQAYVEGDDYFKVKEVYA